jgi:uncharacterized protein involved in exopolysaccharide biosynthesis
MSNQNKKEPNRDRKSSFKEETISLLDLFFSIARHAKVIFMVPIISCFVMTFYALFFTQPVYTSTSKIMSSSSGGNSKSQAIGLAAEFGISIPTSESGAKWVYPVILKSRTLARSVLKRQFDTNKHGFKKSLLEILSSEENTTEINSSRLETLAVDKLLKMINLSEDLKTFILTLNVNALEPKLAAEVNMAFIEELDAHQREYNRAKTSDTKKFIKERIIETKKELMNAEEGLKNFRDRNRRIENSPALQLGQQRLAREVAVLTGVFTTLKQQFETTKIQEVKESEYVVVIDPPEIPLQRSAPNKKKMVILAGIFGIGFGILYALIKEFFSASEKKDRDKIVEIKSLFIKNISEIFFGKIK